MPGPNGRMPESSVEGRQTGRPLSQELRLKHNQYHRQERLRSRPRFYLDPKHIVSTRDSNAGKIPPAVVSQIKLLGVHQRLRLHFQFPPFHR